jgi:Ion channel
MFANLALGTLLILLTVAIHTAGLSLLAHWMTSLVRWFRLHRHYFGKTIAMMTTVLGLFALHTVEVWLWAGAFVWVGVVEGFEDALYLSTVTFSTVGYGDVKANPEWRLFAALESVDGFLLIGWSIAFLIAASTRHGPFRSGEHF